MSKLYCKLPWYSFCVTEDMFAKVCCTSIDNISKIDKNIDLNDTWYNKLSTMRSSLLNNSIPLTCKSCAKVEAFGLRTRRKRFSEELEKSITKIDFDNPKIKFLDIIFSNICNLDCVMCCSKYSSKWISNDKRFLNKYKFRNHVKPYLNTYHLPDEFIKQINIKDLEIIAVKGGEPLIDNKFSYFLYRFIKNRGTAHLHITTNLNEINENIKNQLGELPSISFDISVDGTDELYNFIRGNNASLSKVKKNLKFLLSLKNVTKIKINITTMIYNIWHSYKIIEWANNIDETIKINWCPLCLEPLYLNPIIVPYEIRYEAANNIEHFTKNLDPKYLIDLDYTLNFLKNENPMKIGFKTMKYLRESFLLWTDEMVKIRNINVYDIVPQLKCII
jgi:pyruvate-formate lyase-activating enzyme